MKGGKLLKVSRSTISHQDKKLTDTHLYQDWKTVNCHQVEKSVNKLQARITKAILQNKWNLVKRLQYLLTHSFFAKLLAVKRVTQNKGKRTPGIDGKRWFSHTSKIKAVHSLNGKRYKAKPLKRVFIDKPGKKKTSFRYPYDVRSAMQSLYSLALEPIAETISDMRSFGFRKYEALRMLVSKSFYV
jgi:RNA-directed DNA polymerase